MLTVSNLNNPIKQSESYYLNKIAKQKIQKGFSPEIKSIVKPMFDCSDRIEVCMRHFFDMVDPEDPSEGFPYLQEQFMADYGVSKRTASRRFNELVDKGFIIRHCDYIKVKNQRYNLFWLTEKSLRIYLQVPEINYGANLGTTVQSTFTPQVEFEDLLRDALGEGDALMKEIKEKTSLEAIRSASKLKPEENVIPITRLPKASIDKSMRHHRSQCSPKAHREAAAILNTAGDDLYFRGPQGLTVKQDFTRRLGVLIELWATAGGFRLAVDDVDNVVYKLVYARFTNSQVVAEKLDQYLDRFGIVANNASRAIIYPYGVG